MKIFYFSLLFFIIIIYSSCDEIPNGLYIIKNKANLNLCLMNSSLYFTSEESCQFYIHKKDIPLLNEYDITSDEENKYYFIEDEKTRNKIFYDEISKSLSVSNDTKEFSNFFLWEIIPKKDSFYEIKLKDKKSFISYEDTEEKTTKAICESGFSALAGERRNRKKV